MQADEEQNASIPLLPAWRSRIASSALAGSLALALAGGLYAWRAAPAPQAEESKNLVAATSAVPPQAEVAPARAQEGKAMATCSSPLSSRPAPAPAATSTAVPDIASAVVADPAIRIEHGHEAPTLDPILLAAWQAYRDGDLDTAVLRYGEVLSKNAEQHDLPNRDALLGMAAIAQQRSQDTLAAHYYGQALALDPRDPIAHAGMSALAGAHDPGRIESRLKLLLAQQPDAAALHFALGNHYAGQARWGEAQQAYFSASTLEPDNAQCAFNLAVSLDHLGQRRLAAQYYRRALQLDGKGQTGFDRAHTQLRLDELADR